MKPSILLAFLACFTAPATFASDIQSIAGDWTLEIQEFTDLNAPVEQREFTATVVGENVLFQDKENLLYPYTATFDAESNTLTFARIEMPGYSPAGLTLYQEPFVDLGFMFISQSVTATYDESASTLTFNEDGAGIGWFLYNFELEDPYVDQAGTYLFYSGKKTGGNSVIKELEASDITEPEYYTLQGVRLAAPAPGQIVICRQGTRIWKTILR